MSKVEYVKIVMPKSIWENFFKRVDLVIDLADRIVLEQMRRATSPHEMPDKES